MKGAAHFPYPKLREVLTEQPGWYYERHGCWVKHSSEILANKRRRSRRATQCAEYGGSIMEGHGHEFLIYVGPDIPDKTWEEQRAHYHALFLAQSRILGAHTMEILQRLNEEYVT